jgi:hypothetical protein
MQQLLARTRAFEVTAWTSSRHIVDVQFRRGRLFLGVGHAAEHLLDNHFPATLGTLTVFVHRS